MKESASLEHEVLSNKNSYLIYNLPWDIAKFFNIGSADFKVIWYHFETQVQRLNEMIGKPSNSMSLQPFRTPKEDKEKAYSRIHKWQVSKRENYVNKFQDTFKAVMLTSSMIKKVIKCPRNSLTNSGNPTECPHQTEKL